MNEKINYSYKLTKLMNKYLPDNVNENTPLSDVLEGRKYFPKILEMLENERAAELKRIEEEREAEKKRREKELKRIEEKKAAELKRIEEEKTAELKRREEELLQSEKKEIFFDKVNRLYNTIRQSITKDYNGQTTEILEKAAARIKNGNHDDYKLANIILKMKYDWKTEKGDTFHSTLSNFDFELEKTEREAQERETKEQENKKRLQERENEKRELLKRAEEEKDTAYGIFYLSLVAIIIGIIVLFYTGHWFFGILGIIFFLIYALSRHVDLYYKYNEQARN